ncbi:hypothetical protein Mapa_017691 [Marchantia paleacea]|nr:hypothetical protein Mapa_017691 [Marchantia paleacea]
MRASIVGTVGSCPERSQNRTNYYVCVPNHALRLYVETKGTGAFTRTNIAFHRHRKVRQNWGENIPPIIKFTRAAPREQELEHITSTTTLNWARDERERRSWCFSKR